MRCAFNQDGACFAVARARGANRGFTVYTTSPYRETFGRVFRDGGVARAEMLFRCNIVALVGGGDEPKFSPHKVMIWDDHQGRCIGELAFKVPVRGVRLRRDKIIVALEHKVFVYQFSNLELERQIDTSSNVDGLCVISPTTETTVMACPGLNTGQVRVELFDLGTTKFIAAHEAPLACLALSADGRLLATASEKGTLIRVFDTFKACLLHEFRRGSDRATIYSLAFSPRNNLLGATSDKGTVHVFRIPDSATAPTSYAAASPAPVGASASAAARATGASTSVASFLGKNKFVKSLLPKYFHSEWSMAQFKLSTTKRSIVTFPATDSDTIVVVSETGEFTRLIFDDVAGGVMRCVESHNFAIADPARD
jgi:WD40 repeat protein